MRPSRVVLLVVLASAWLVAFGVPSASAGMKFANMTGAQEAPAPATPTARAWRCSTSRSATGQVCISQRHNNIAAPTLMHIHAAPPASRGRSSSTSPR